MCSLPEDQVIMYRKRTKTDTNVADSAGLSREDQVKFIQVEVEGREEGRMSREITTSWRSSANRKATVLLTPASSTVCRSTGSTIIASSHFKAWRDHVFPLWHPKTRGV
ncbi:hypothetical protein MTO96_025627 [Rhipicephalus appendiculatus]